MLQPSQAEKLTPPPQQRSWQAFERIFGVIQAQGLPKDVSIAQYRAWIARYPDEPSLYAQFLQFLVAGKEYPAAAQLIADYRKQFPNDQIFPVKAKAMVEYRRGSVREGLVGLRAELSAALGSATGEKLFRSAARHAESAQVPR
jgi:cellulose synthase operon protein C